MKFSTRTDIELPPERLFSAITDFDRLERILRRRGAAVTAFGPQGAIGSGWQIGFDWRGRRRNLRLEIAEIVPGERVLMTGRSDAFELTVAQSIVALGKARGRVVTEVEVKPRGMRARLLLQTAKLGKHQLDLQFDRGASKLLAELVAA